MEGEKEQQMSDHDLLVRIDERTRSFHEHADKRIRVIENTIKTDLVKKTEFRPVRAVVYSAVSIVGAGVLLGILGLLLD